MNNQVLLAENRFRKNLITSGEFYEIMQKHPLADLNEVSSFLYDAKRRLNNYLSSRPKLKYPVKKYANYKVGSDTYPFEVIRQVSPNVVEVRAMETKQVVFPVEFHQGGFCGHYSDNHNQKYEYFSNEQNPIIRINLSKKGWGKGHYWMSEKPHKFYDYNF